MQAGGLAAVIPRAFRLAPRPPTGPEEHRIAAADGDSRELFPRLEILHIQCLTLLEVRHPLEQRHVDEDATRHVARTHLVDRRPAHAPLAGVHHWTPAIDPLGSLRVAFVLHGVVAERVDMAVPAVVGREADRIEGGAADLGGLRVLPGYPMPVEDPHVRRVRHRLVQVDRVREVIEADRDALCHQRHGRLRLLRRDQIQRAAVVVRAPAAPVLLLFEPLEHLLVGHQALGQLRRGVWLGPTPLLCRRDGAFRADVSTDAERQHACTRQNNATPHQDGHACHSCLTHPPAELPSLNTAYRLPRPGMAPIPFQICSDLQGRHQLAICPSRMLCRGLLSAAV